MSEMSEVGKGSESSVEVLEPHVTRQVLYVTSESRGALLTKDFDQFIVRNQQQFGRGVDDAAIMAKTHEKIDETGLGVRETVVRQFNITVGGEKVAVQDTSPSVRTTWVGDKYVKLMTPDEASKIVYAGKTALAWATVEGVAPERVVKAQNRLFYPATSKDTVVVADQPSRN